MIELLAAQYSQHDKNVGFITVMVVVLLIAYGAAQKKNLGVILLCVAAVALAIMGVRS